MSPFGDILERAIKAADLTRSEFARRARVHPSEVTRAANGERSPPKHKIARWAEILGLRGDDAQAFMDAAWLAHADDHVKAFVERLEQRIARLERETERLRLEVARQDPVRRVGQTDPRTPRQGG